MINFNVTLDDISTPISSEESQTILELKILITAVYDLNLNDVSLFLQGFGLLDSDILLEQPISHFGLKCDQTYLIVVFNYHDPSKMWKSCCTQKIFGSVLIAQPGCYINTNNGARIPICYACALFCAGNSEEHERFLEKNFQCMCKCLNSNSCVFSPDFDLKITKENVYQNINSILFAHADQLYKKEKTRIQVINTQVLGRSFNFEYSINLGLARVFLYEDMDVQSTVLSILDKPALENEARENSMRSNLDYRDELVKSLLLWFKTKLFTWCDTPICKTCERRSDNFLSTDEANTEENAKGVWRVELYACNQCGITCRFPRYTSAKQLCETRTGRCSEWANLFGCILRCMGYDVRFLDNFENHVWNEYWSESLQRWIHVDSCENAWDTPLLYEQGWGRNMTFILGYSINGVYDVTRRYVKDWNLISSRRSPREEDKLAMLMTNKNESLRKNFSKDLLEYLTEREKKEIVELLKVKTVKEAEMIERQSGSLEWRKERGEIK